MKPAHVPIGNTGFAGTMEAAGIEPANDSYRPKPAPRLILLLLAESALLAWLACWPAVLG